MDSENKKLALDAVILASIFFVACFAGKTVMENGYDGWFPFNITAIGTLVIGVSIWLRIRKI